MKKRKMLVAAVISVFMSFLGVLGVYADTSGVYDANIARIDEKQSLLGDIMSEYSQSDTSAEKTVAINTNRVILNYYNRINNLRVDERISRESLSNEIDLLYTRGRVSGKCAWLYESHTGDYGDQALSRVRNKYEKMLGDIEAYESESELAFAEDIIQNELCRVIYTEKIRSLRGASDSQRVIEYIENAVKLSGNISATPFDESAYKTVYITVSYDVSAQRNRELAEMSFSEIYDKIYGKGSYSSLSQSDNHIKDFIASIEISTDISEFNTDIKTAVSKILSAVIPDGKYTNKLYGYFLDDLERGIDSASVSGKIYFAEGTFDDFSLKLSASSAKDALLEYANSNISEGNGERLSALIFKYNGDGGMFDRAEDIRKLDFELGRAKIRVDWLGELLQYEKTTEDIFAELDATRALQRLADIYAPVDDEIGGSATLEAAREVLEGAKERADLLMAEFEKEAFLERYSDVIEMNIDDVSVSDKQRISEALLASATLRESSWQLISKQVADIVLKYKKCVSLYIDELSEVGDYREERSEIADAYKTLIGNIKFVSVQSFIRNSENIEHKAEAAFLVFGFYENVINSTEYKDFPDDSKEELSDKLRTYLGRIYSVDHTLESIDARLASLLGSAELELCRTESAARIRILTTNNDSDEVIGIIEGSLKALNYADSAVALREMVDDTVLRVYAQRKIEQLSHIATENIKAVKALTYLTRSDISGIQDNIWLLLESTEQRIAVARDTDEIDVLFSESEKDITDKYGEAIALDLARAVEFFTDKTEKKAKTLVGLVSSMKYISDDVKQSYTERIENEAERVMQELPSYTGLSDVEGAGAECIDNLQGIYDEVLAENTSNAKRVMRTRAQDIHAILCSDINSLVYISSDVREELMSRAQNCFDELTVSLEGAVTVEKAEELFESYSSKAGIIRRAAESEELAAAKEKYSAKISEKSDSISSEIALLRYLDVSDKGNICGELDSSRLSANGAILSSGTVSEVVSVYEEFYLVANVLIAEARGRDLSNAKKSANAEISTKAEELITALSALGYLSDGEKEEIKRGAEGILSGTGNAIAMASDVATAESIRDSALSELSGRIKSAMSLNVENARSAVRSDIEKAFALYSSDDYGREKYDAMKKVCTDAITRLEKAIDIKTFVEIKERAISEMSAVPSIFSETLEEVVAKLKLTYDELFALSQRYSEKNFMSVTEIYERTLSELEVFDRSLGIDELRYLVDSRIELMKSIKADWISNGNVGIDTGSKAEYPAGFDNDKNGLWGIVSADGGISPEVKLEISLKDILNSHKSTLRSALKASNISYFGDSALNDAELARLIKDSDIKAVFDIRLIKDKALYDTSSGSYTVRILLPSHMRDIERPCAVYIRADGSAEYYEAEIDGCFLVFETEHFSEFMILGERVLDLTPIIIFLAVSAALLASIAAYLTYKASKKKVELMSVMGGMSMLRVVIPNMGVAITIMLFLLNIFLVVYIVFALKHLQRSYDREKVTVSVPLDIVSEEKESRAVSYGVYRHTASLPTTLDSVSAEEADSLVSDREIAFLVVRSETHSHICRGCKKTFINVDTISDNFNAGDTVSITDLKKKRLIPMSSCYIKVLARGEIDKPLTIKAQSFSANAVKMITLTGGTAVLEGNSEYVENKQ